MVRRRQVWWAVLAVMAVVLVAACDMRGPDGDGSNRTPVEPTRTPTAREVEPAGTATDVETEPGAGTDPETDVERVYLNEVYGFSFRYPAGWDIMEGRNYVSLRRGATNLVIGYRHGTEDPNVCCRQQLPEGELVTASPVPCAGEALDKALLTCEGETKAMIYEGAEEVSLGDLRFLFYVQDFSADYEMASIPEDVQRQVDGVINSLETFEPGRQSATATPRPTRLPPTPVPTENPTPRPAKEPTATPPAALAEAQPEGANVRSGPGTDYGLNGSLQAGERVPIIGRRGDWWQISYKGGQAWIYDGVVTAINAEGVLEVEAVPTRVASSPGVIPTAAPPAAIDEARWIDVSLSEQRLRAYENGQVVRTTLVSTGLPETPTVKGQYRIWIKLRYDDMEGEDYYLEDVPYAMYFYEGYGLHGTFWHSNFGQPMSHGCVNLPTDEAAWLFDFADVGTLVNVRD